MAEEVAGIIRRAVAAAAGLGVYELDLELAVAVARRDVAAVHGRAEAAALWQELVLGLTDLRDLHTEMRQELERVIRP